MRTYALAIAAAALFALPTSAFSQGIELGPGGVRIEPGYHGYFCAKLSENDISKVKLGDKASFTAVS